MRCVAMASERVTVGSSPSGTLATMMPMANIALSQKGRPIAVPIAKNASPRIEANAATRCDRRAISRCSGETSLPTVCVRCAMRPNSVRMPVA